MTDNTGIKQLLVQIPATYYERDQIKGPEQLESPEQRRKSSVYKGIYGKDTLIAVKRYEKEQEDAVREAKKCLEVLRSRDENHQHIVRFYGETQDTDFSYILTERCECSVADIVDEKRKKDTLEKITRALFNSIMINLPAKEILRQSCIAVSYLHSLGMIHRNLHPDNFLIASAHRDKKSFLVKLTDFQFYKNLTENTVNSGTSNKEGWVAPESIRVRMDITSKLDAFIMGLYLYYVISRGIHPFGEIVLHQRENIGNKAYLVYQAGWEGGNPECNVGDKWQEEGNKMALAMIKDVTKYDPEQRKSVDDILESKYFKPVESYKIYNNPESPKPGLCVIVTQSKHYNSIMDLELDVVCGKLDKTFRSKGLEVLHFKNLRSNQIVQFLSPQNLANETSTNLLTEFASLVICIVAHGNKGVVYGVDMIPVELNQLQYAFNGDILRDKPKIFIVFSCRGDIEQLTLSSNNSIPNNQTPATVTLSLTASPNTPTTPPLIDFLVLMSNMDGFKSHLGQNAGSDFIDHLCDALDSEYSSKDPNNRDLHQLFSTVVIPKVGRLCIPVQYQDNGQIVDCLIKQTPESRSTLTKTIRFQPSEPLVSSQLAPYDGKFRDSLFELGRQNFESSRKYSEALKSLNASGVP